MWLGSIVTPPTAGTSPADKNKHTNDNNKNNHKHTNDNNKNNHNK
jgi:hypothetical protein